MTSRIECCPNTNLIPSCTVTKKSVLFCATTVALTLGYVFCAPTSMFGAADEITEMLNVAAKRMEVATKSSSSKEKYEKLNEAKTVLTEAMDKMTASGKVYTDEEWEPFYTLRGYCFYQLCEYDQSLRDLTNSVKLNPKKITPWVRISMIKSSAPDIKLRDALEAAEASLNALKLLAIVTTAAANVSDPVARQQIMARSVKVKEECVDAYAAGLAECGKFKEAITALKNEDEQRVKDKIEQYRNSKPNRLPAQFQK